MSGNEELLAANIFTFALRSLVTPVALLGALLLGHAIDPEVLLTAVLDEAAHAGAGV